MSIPTRLLLYSSLAVLLACVDPLEAPPCNAVTLNQTSVSGDTVTLNTGLRYIEGAPGSGAGQAQWCALVVTHHTEYLLDGTRLDSTHDTDNPIAFTPGYGDLIDGYEQGVIGMRSGGSRRLIVPPHLAYGSVPQRNAAGEIIIPANSTLVYDIEAFNVPE